MLRDADAIVRALAVEYAVPPQTSRQSDSLIRFRVLEVIRGTDMPTDLIQPGYLSDRDDFNSGAVPYTIVRRMGQGGSCYADFYRSGGQFLLFLKRLAEGAYTTKWYPLGPVNEQLRSETDPWLLWVRQEAK